MGLQPRSRSAHAMTGTRLAAHEHAVAKTLNTSFFKYTNSQVCESKMRIERNDDPKVKQKKSRKGLRREFAQCIERIPSGPPRLN